jgi:hypothetical protein
LRKALPNIAVPKMLPPPAVNSEETPQAPLVFVSRKGSKFRIAIEMMAQPGGTTTAEVSAQTGGWDPSNFAKAAQVNGYSLRT